MRSLRFAMALILAGPAVAQDTKFPDFSIGGVEIRPGPFDGSQVFVLVENASAKAANVWADCMVLGNDGSLVDVLHLRVPNIPPKGSAIQSALVGTKIIKAECRVTDVD